MENDIELKVLEIRLLDPDKSAVKARADVMVGNLLRINDIKITKDRTAYENLRIFMPARKSYEDENLSKFVWHPDIEFCDPRLFRRIADLVISAYLEKVKTQ
jgi:DNA-binding cell septation regulator SpoVG